MQKLRVCPLLSVVFCLVWKPLKAAAAAVSRAAHSLSFAVQKALNSQRQISVATLEALRNGDHDAFKLVYLHYVENIRDFLVTLTRDEETSKEMTQAIFITLWEKRVGIDPHSNISGYLYTIARNNVFKYFDHLKVERKYQAEAAHTMDNLAESDDTFIVEEIEHLVDKAIDRMPEQRRRIFSMFYYESLTPDKICERLDLKRSTVETHLALARKTLKEVM